MQIVDLDDALEFCGVLDVGVVEVEQFVDLHVL